MTHQTRARTESTAHRTAPKSPPHENTVNKRWQRRLARPLQGVLWGGSAFLLGACPTLFGAAPLGLALLSAASSYTWYILAGLLLSAALFPVTLSGWTWAGVYLLCIILRLTIRFFVDPPTLPDGRPCRGRTYLRLCWVSFKRNAGLLSRRDSDEDYADYYPGADPTADKPVAGSTPPPASDFHPRLFWEHPFLRMLTAAASGLVAGVFGLIMGGLHLYDLLAALVLLFLTPCATFLLVACFGEAGMTLLFCNDPLGRCRAAPQGSRSGESITQKFHALPLCSVCFLLGCVVFAARSFTPVLGTPYLTVSLATLLGLVLTLTAATRMGAIPGLAAGVICGLAANPSLSPIFILCAGGYALLSPMAHRVGVVGGCIAGATWCLAVEGVTALLPMLPAILLTPPLFLISERLWSAIPSPSAGREGNDDDLQDITELLSSVLTLESRSRAGQAKMKALSEAFDALSKRFYSLSDQLKRPRMLDLRNICDESFGKQCARCRNRDVCWGTEYDRTLEVQARLSSQLHAGGKATVESLPDSLRDFCPHMESMVADINSRCARMTENLLRSEQSDVFAADYAAIAALLTDALEEERREAQDFTCNREVADAVYDYLTEQGFKVQGVVVGGKQSRRQRVIVRGSDFRDIDRRMEEIQAGLEDICGVKLTPPVFEEEGNGVVMTLCSEAVLTAEYAGSTVPAGQNGRDPLPPPLTHDTPAGEYTPPAICGDHLALFKTDNAYLYALISDGMGAGEEASLTSDICTMFLEKMLTAGNKVDISLRMLDTYIRSKNRGTGEECSATVDLMELDLMDGQAVFAKNGAAPTYVVRDGKVYKLHAPTMPIGILSDVPRKDLRFRTHPGDVVVMVSDGVTLGNDECPWLIDLLSSPMPRSMDSLRTDIIRRALSAGSEDDLSAIAIRVEE